MAPMRTVRAAERVTKRVGLLLASQWLQTVKPIPSPIIGGDPTYKSDKPVPGVKHIWPHDELFLAYELRDGNPPSDSDRPKWLRGVSIVVDVKEIVSRASQALIRDMRADGSHRDIDAKTAEFLVQDLIQDKTPDPVGSVNYGGH